MKIVTLLGMVAAALLASSCLLGGYTVGGTITGLRGSGLVLRNSSGKYAAVSANGVFTFPTSVANGDLYSVTVKTQPSYPTQICTVNNGSGTIAKANVTTVLVSCTQAGRFAYVANRLANSISAFSIDANTGTLTPLAGSPFASTGASPMTLTVDSSGTFLYVVNNDSNSVSIFAINDTTGILTLSRGAVVVGNKPIGVTVDPTNRFLYVANSVDNTVSAFDVAMGVATPIAGSPFFAGYGPTALQAAPNGKFLYVTNFAVGGVTVMAIDANTGALSNVPGTPFSAGAGAVSVAIDSTGSFAYVANETAGSLSAYTINSTSGALTAVSGSPLSAGSSAESVVVNPAGTFLYAANVTSVNQVASYAITPLSGTLTLGTSVNTGILPIALAVDPAGTFLYVTNLNSNSISVFSIDATGALAGAAGSPFAVGAGARSIAID